MLPSFLHSTYKQYKENTSYVADWLAQTAKSRGYALLRPGSTTTAPKLIPKKVIKNKKTALQAEQAREAREVQLEPYAIPTEELLPLAQYISECNKPPVIIPGSVLSTIARTIKARQRTNDYYTEVGSNTDESDGHAYFIRTLESIFKLLKPVDSPQMKPQHRRGGGQSDAPFREKSRGPLDVNLSILDLEDPESPDLESFDRPTPDHRPPPADGHRPLFSVEPMTEEEKAKFAVQCLLYDIRRIVAHVSGLWEL